MNLLIPQAIFGFLTFLFIGWVFSENRKKLDIKIILTGIILQICLAFMILKISIIRLGFETVAEGISKLKDATLAGTKFVFGYVGGGDIPFQYADGKGIGDTFIFAFQPLPMIMVVSALAMLLFHWKLLPIVVNIFSTGLKKALNIGGALGVCCAAKIFLGQTDAPLLIRPYLSKFSRSELFTVMTAGMATTSSTIMVLYATILETTITNPIAHILTASIISIPAAIVISRIIVPHEGEHTSGDLVTPYHFSGSMDAVSQGANDGMKLFLAIIAMLVVTLALVYLLNTILAIFPNVGDEAITLQRILGYIMSPLAWLMGIPWEEAVQAGKLLGVKTTLNEVVAFITFAELPKAALSEHSDIIMMYALCGFANFSSIGIQIGGIGSMVPERRTEIISLSFKALMAGTLASCMSGTVVGLIHWFG